MTQYKWLIAVLLISIGSFAATDSLPSVAVIDFAGRGVSSEDAVTMAERFSTELMERGRFQVLERARINEVMKEVALQQAVCSDAECAVDIGKLIAARKVVLGTVAKVGGIYTVNIKLTDVETGKIEVNISEDCDCSIEEVLTGTLRRMADKLGSSQRAGEGMVFSLQKGDASAFIKSVPEKARVIIDGKIADGYTPITIQGLSPGRHVIRVQKGDSAAVKIISAESGRITRVSVDLKPQQTALKVLSEPSETEVYFNASPGKSRWPDQVTPAVFENVQAEKVKLTLFKPGYFDTSFTVNLLKNRENTVRINMNAADSSYSRLQHRFILQRKQRRIGLSLSIGSGIVAAGGIAAFVLAKKDYDDALEARELLDKSVIKSGPDYEAALEENRIKSESGDSKYIKGALLSGAALIGLATGIVLYF